MFPSRFMPCPECGGSVERAERDVHSCEPERRLDYRMHLLREEVATFESQFRGFVDTRDGRFESWVAFRRVRAARG